MTKCVELLKLQQQLNEAEIFWHLFRVPPIVTGISLSSNSEGDRKHALSIRNSAAQKLGRRRPLRSSENLPYLPGRPIENQEVAYRQRIWKM